METYQALVKGTIVTFFYYGHRILKTMTFRGSLCSPEDAGCPEYFFHQWPQFGTPSKRHDELNFQQHEETKIRWC